METKALAWDQGDRAQIPLDRLIEEYCKSSSSLANSKR